MLWESGCGFPGIAAGLDAGAGEPGRGARADELSEYKNPLAPKPPHHDPDATACIFLYMYGGPSHMDTFDYKPEMIGRDNQTIAVKTFGRGGHKNEGRIVEPRWKFKQYGECGKWVSDLFPNLAEKVDDIAFLHSMTADSPIHGSAMLMMNSGKILSGSPCLGSWLNYGLGTVNEESARVLSDARSTWRPHQRAEELEQRLHACHLSGDRHAVPGQSHPRPGPSTRSQFGGKAPVARHTARIERGARIDALRQLELAARIASYELAYKMQAQCARSR